MSEERLKELRSLIGEIGQEIDSYKAVTAAYMGGGVFLLLLALGAVYDLLTGNTSLWSKFAITRTELYWIVAGLSVSSMALMAMATTRQRGRDRKREARLAELEDEMADLLDQQDTQPHLDE